MFSCTLPEIQFTRRLIKGPPAPEGPLSNFRQLEIRTVCFSSLFVVIYRPLTERSHKPKEGPLQRSRRIAPYSLHMNEKPKISPTTPYHHRSHSFILLPEISNRNFSITFSLIVFPEALLPAASVTQKP